MRNKFAPYFRLIIIPATQEVYRQAMRERLSKIFLDAKGVISTPTCGPCVGGHMGVLAKGERAISTTNRNFIGQADEMRGSTMPLLDSVVVRNIFLCLIEEDITCPKVNPRVENTRSERLEKTRGRLWGTIKNQERR